MRNPLLFSYFIVSVFILSLQSCISNKQPEEIPTVETMNDIVTEGIRQRLSNNGEAGNDITDSIQYSKAIVSIYRENNFAPLWSNKEVSKPIIDTFISYLQHSILDGLFPEDYNFKKLNDYFTLIKNDSIARIKKPALWIDLDIHYTAALLQVIYDLKYGRLVADSLAHDKNNSNYDSTLASYAKNIISSNDFYNSLKRIQPKHNGYWELKKGIQKFLDSMDTKQYTYLDFPVTDSALFVINLGKRLKEAGYLVTDEKLKDTAYLAGIITKYQIAHHLTNDGKSGREVIYSLNNTDNFKLKRYALTLDRYKGLPAQMPKKYIWVNLPSYYLKVWENDSMVLKSKIICGKPNTSTPTLTSAITNMILYPTWTVPESIIKKDMIPGLKRDPGYLKRKGLYLLNNKQQKIDPYSVNWNKYNNGIPFLVQQASGDNNALGVVKFNFNNPYSVYLHDTNQRYLFKKSMRALSHGCVRVEQWENLANYIARNDSMSATDPKRLSYTTDSIKNWLKQGLLHKIDVKNRLPLYITYFGCEFANGHVIFYDDIYKQDQALIQKYFERKKISL